MSSDLTFVSKVDLGSYALPCSLRGLSKASNWPAGNCEPLHRETEIADQGKKEGWGREGGVGEVLPRPMFVLHTESHCVGQHGFWTMRSLNYWLG